MIVNFKKFESNSNKFYTQISWEDMSQKTSIFSTQFKKRPEEAVNFTQREVDILKNILDESIRNKRVYSYAFPPDFRYILRIDGSYPIRYRPFPRGEVLISEGYPFDLTIWKVEDEFFWVTKKVRVRHVDTYFPNITPDLKTPCGYICDQFEGLIKLLNDLGT